MTVCDRMMLLKSASVAISIRYADACADACHVNVGCPGTLVAPSAGAVSTGAGDDLGRDVDVELEIAIDAVRAAAKLERVRAGCRGVVDRDVGDGRAGRSHRIDRVAAAETGRQRRRKLIVTGSVKPLRGLMLIVTGSSAVGVERRGADALAQVVGRGRERRRAAAVEAERGKTRAPVATGRHVHRRSSQNVQPSSGSTPMPK